MSVARSLKHWRHMSIPYFLIKPVWELQTRHCLEPLPKFLGWEYQTVSWAILLEKLVSLVEYKLVERVIGTPEANYRPLISQQFTYCLD